MDLKGQDFWDEAFQGCGKEQPSTNDQVLAFLVEGIEGGAKGSGEALDDKRHSN
jgi:hypothetical protein